MSKLREVLTTAGLDLAGRLVTRGVNTQIWVDAKTFVAAEMDSSLSNIEKHTKVKTALQSIFEDVLEEVSFLASSILDIAIKLAFVYLSAKAEVAGKK